MTLGHGNVPLPGLGWAKKSFWECYCHGRLGAGEENRHGEELEVQHGPSPQASLTPQRH